MCKIELYLLIVCQRGEAKCTVPFYSRGTIPSSNVLIIAIQYRAIKTPRQSNEQRPDDQRTQSTTNEHNQRLTTMDNNTTSQRDIDLCGDWAKEETSYHFLGE